MAINKYAISTEVSGPVTVDLNLNASKHTVSCANAATSGTVTVTVNPYGMSTAQVITDNTIDLSAAAPLFIEGHIESMTLSISSGTFKYSIVGTD